MSDTRQQLIRLINQMTPVQQDRALRMIQSMTQQRESEERGGDGFARPRPDGPQQMSADDTALFDEFVGGVDAEPFADDADDLLYGS